MSHRRRNVSLLLLFLQVSLALFQFPTVHAVASPIAFTGSAKSGLLIGTANFVVVTPNKNDMIIVEEYDSCCPTVTISDSQGNAYTRFPNNNVAGAHPLSQFVFNARALSSAADNITVTLSSSKTVGLLAATYTGVASVVGSTVADLAMGVPTYSDAGQANSAPNNMSIPESTAAGPVTVGTNDWFVGASANSIQDTCLGAAGVCFNSPCTLLQGCVNQVQRLLDEGTTISAEMTDSGAPIPTPTFSGTCVAHPLITGWCWRESFNHGDGANTEYGVLGELLDLVCCFVPPGPNDQPGAGGFYVSQTDIIYGSVASALILAALAFIVGVRRKRA